MAFFRLAFSTLPKLIPARNSVIKKEILTSKIFGCFYQERYFRKSYGRILRTMKVRREIAGPERVRHRNEWDNWNYKTELYAFSRRLHENISEDTLRNVFIHESYLKMEEQKRKGLDIPLQDVQLDLKSNASLINQGHKITSNYVKRYLRHCFPKIPEEGIIALHGYLLSDEVLSHVSFNIGTSDLIFCAEYPPDKPTLAATLMAVIGSIATEDSVLRAEAFVLDFVCPQIIGKDVLELWDIEDPLSVLNAILVKHSLQECEPRLIFESGRNTIEAIYHVGLYSDKVFLGRGPGETLPNAVEMAAYDALRRIFDLKENEKALHFGLKAKTLELKSETEHPRLSEWYSETLNINESIKQ